MFLLKSKTELQEHCTISEGSWAELGEERKSSLEHLSQYVLPKEVDFLHNLRIKLGHCQKSSSDTNDSTNKFRMNMTPITDVFIKMWAHKLTSADKIKSFTARWNCYKEIKCWDVINIVIQNLAKKKKKNWWSFFPILLSFTVWQI